MARKGRFLEPLAIAFASGSSLKDAAKQANCSNRQATRIAKSPEFKELVSTIRTAITQQVVGVLGKESVKAVEVLAKLRDDKNQSGAVRVSAAKTILANLPTAMDLYELRSRIDELEAQAAS